MDYVKPEVADYGDLTELTEGLNHGENLDKDFPTGTPRGELTFS